MHLLMTLIIGAVDESPWTNVQKSLLAGYSSTLTKKCKENRQKARSKTYKSTDAKCFLISLICDLCRMRRNSFYIRATV